VEQSEGYLEFEAGGQVYVCREFLGENGLCF